MIEIPSQASFFYSLGEFNLNSFHNESFPVMSKKICYLDELGSTNLLVGCSKAIYL